MLRGEKAVCFDIAPAFTQKLGIIFKDEIDRLILIKARQGFLKGKRRHHLTVGGVVRVHPKPEKLVSHRLIKIAAVAGNQAVCSCEQQRMDVFVNPPGCTQLVKALPDIG